MAEYFCREQKINMMEDIAKIRFFRKKKLECMKVERGIVLPSYTDDKLIKSVSKIDKPTFGWGGIATEDHIFVSNSQMCAAPLINEGMICKKRFGGGYFFDDSQIEQYIDEEVIYAGFFWKQWGHFLIDIIGRLWFALEHSDLRIVFIVDKSSNINLSGNYLELIELMGINSNRILFVDSMIQFRAIYVPETSFYPGKFFSSEYLAMIKRVKRSVNRCMEGATAFNNIYFSRSKFSGDEVGEKVLEKLLKRNGFKVLYPEKLSVAEQVYYIANAKKIASMSGSIAHNALFTDEETEWYVFERDARINPYQIQIDQMAKCKMVFIDAYHVINGKSDVRRPILLRCTGEVKRFLKNRGYKETVIESSIAEMISWIIYSLKVLKRVMTRRLKSFICIMT